MPKYVAHGTASGENSDAVAATHEALAAGELSVDLINKILKKAVSKANELMKPAKEVLEKQSQTSPTNGTCTSEDCRRAESKGRVHIQNQEKKEKKDVDDAGQATELQDKHNLIQTSKETAAKEKAKADELQKQKEELQKEKKNKAAAARKKRAAERKRRAAAMKKRAAEKKTKKATAMARLKARSARKRRARRRKSSFLSKLRKAGKKIFRV